MEHVDVIVVGAGLSGIGGACHLKMQCPKKSFVILEGRETMGGTWDLFRYPGVRSDSDMTLVYKGMMFSDIPNLAFAVGYTNASWTLKCDLTAEYVCRLLNHMDQHGYAVCTPRVNDPDIEEEPVLDFNSGYVLRALDTLPRQGSKTPWRLHQNYVRDLSMMRYRRVADGTMEFKSAPIV